MSTQLILFPQNYNGQYNSITNPTAAFTNFISNGQIFTGLGSTTLYNSKDIKPPLAAIINEHPSIVNTWYRFTTIVGLPGNWAAVVAPSVALNKLVLSVGSGGEGHTGVYQQLTGLTVGATYSVKIAITTGQVGTISLATYLPNTGVEEAGAQFSSLTTAINWNFTATSTNQILSLDYIGDTVELFIESIVVLSITTLPSGVFTDLINGQVICDLYQEEDIPLTLSIDDFKNVAEKVQSYSKDFNLPATKRNNRIFNNMFEVTRADDGIIFNPYVKTKCVLKQDGFILFEGYLRLIDAKDKDGEISYNVNLYSDVIALADVLKNLKFSDLDFSELSHTYDRTSIQDSWEDVGAGQGLPLLSPLLTTSFAYDAVTGTGHTQVLKYPFIDWTHQYIVGGTGSPNATANNPELTSLEQAFRPCIQLKYLINKIFADTGFNWTSDFFDSADFEKLFMDFNWGGDNNPSLPATGNSYNGIGPTSVVAATTSYSALQLQDYGVWNWYLPPNYNTTTHTINATTDGETYTIDYSYYLVNGGAGDIVAEFRWLHNTTPIDYTTHTILAGNFDVWVGNFTVTMSAGDTLVAQFKTDTAGVNLAQWTTTSNEVHFTTSILSVTSNALLQTQRGELGQWEFLEGLMTMFNLVSMVDDADPNNILIEPYADVFVNNTSGTTLALRSVQHDWTDKVDVSQMDLKPLTDLNQNTIFKFIEDDEDYAFNVYKNATTGHLYGSREFDASGFTLLQGTKEIEAKPFAATVSKPLDPVLPDFIVPTIYAMAEDGTEGFDNSPRIFYNNGIKNMGATYYIPTQNGVIFSNTNTYLQFSHLSELPPGTVSTTRKDFVFASHQLWQPIGASPVDNLFNTYWLPYFNELYSPDTRTMTLKVNLSPSDVASFKFYDKVFIKNRTFRVNKIQYKPNSLATVEFILIT